MAAALPTHSSDQLPLLSPLAEDHFENPPEYYAPTPHPTTTTATTTALAPRSVRFRSPPADTPRENDNTNAQSLPPPYSPPAQSYRGYGSQAEYLVALKEWAEEKAMMAPADKSLLTGFYGKETIEECIAKNPKLRSGRRKSQGSGVQNQSNGTEDGCEGLRGQRLDEDRGRRKSSIGQWLRRKSMS